MRRQPALLLATLACAAALAGAGCARVSGTQPAGGVRGSELPSVTASMSAAGRAAFPTPTPSAPATPGVVPTRSPGALPPVAAALAAHGLRSGRKAVALTFDLTAVPDSGLDQAVYAALLRTRTPATFMMSGAWVAAHPRDAAMIASVPFFEVGQHGYAGDQPLTLSNAELRADATMAEQAIYTGTHRVPRLYRFAYNASDARTLAVISGLGLTPIAFDVNSYDTSARLSAKTIANSVARGVRPGSIVLLHGDGTGVNSAAALPALIAQLKAKGYQLVTAHELLGVPSDTSAP